MGARHCSKLAAIAIGFAASPARAQEPNAVIAETLFREGKRLMSERRFDEACAKFSESQRVDPAAGTLLNLAECEEAAGRSATAWAGFHDAMAAARKLGQAERIAFAMQRIRALEPKLVRLTIERTDGGRTPGLEVRVDGVAVSAPAFGVATPVDPGRHVVEARAPGRSTFRREIETRAPGGAFTVEVPELEPLAGAASGEPAGGAGLAPGAEPSASSGAQRALAFAAGGLGVVGIGVGIAFNLKANSENDDAVALCVSAANGVCQVASASDRRKRDDLLDAARRDRTISYVGLGLGTAALVTSGVLFLALPEARAAARAVEIAPLAGPDFAGAFVSGRF